MKFMRLLIALLLLAGCSHARIDASTRTSAGAVVPSAGTTVTSGQAGVHIQSYSLAAVVVAGMFMAGAIEDAREPRPMPSFSVFSDWFRGTPRPPQMADDRTVMELDCSKPIPEGFAGNLRCR